MNAKKIPKLTVILLAALTMKSMAQATSARFVITDYGAVGDGTTMNTKAIQAVIDRIAVAGGGMLVVPKGTFMSGALFFKQGVDLDVEADGVLKGTIVKDEYPQINSRWEGEERVWTSAFLNFDKMTHVTITGDGTIDGSGDLWMQREPRIRRPAGRGLGTQPATLPALPAPPASGTNGGPRFGRPRLVCIANCDDVHISNVHLIKQAIWCLHILYSQNVSVDHVTVDAMGFLIPSSDGMDIDSSHDITVSNCSISCNDDDISIKSGKNDNGRLINKPSENITISDCTIGAGGGIAMGSEVSGSVRHVLVQRCVFNHTDAGARFKSSFNRGGVVEDIVFKDITINGTRWAFDFNLAWGGGGGRGFGGGATPTPPITQTITRNIQMINYHGTSRTGGTIRGLANGPFQDVKFINCDISAQTGIWLDNAKDLDTAGLNLKLQSGPLFIKSATRPTG